MTGSPDMAATLGELERKLKDLERELASAAGPSPATAPGLTAVPPLAAEPVPVPAAAPAPAERDVVISTPATGTELIGEAQETLARLRLQVEQLVQFRERLERSAHELIGEYSRVLEGLQAAAPAASVPVAEPATAPAAPAVPPPPAVPVSTLPPAHARSGPGPDDGRTYSGALTVEAGPFADIATLSSFEQALGHLPGAQDVYVRAFEGDRALIDLVLGSPVAVGDELRRLGEDGFTITGAGADHLSITLDRPDHA